MSTATTRNRGGWTKTSLEYLAKVQATLDELRGYWPLTLRQVYYQLVATGEIDNNRNQYQRLSRVLSKARIDGLVSWKAIEDRVRSSLFSSGWCSPGDFIRDETS